MGYLANPDGDILNNRDGGKMMDKDQLSDKGDLPAPLNVEKYNFNPIKSLGDFDYNMNGEPKIKPNKDGSLGDKKGNPVSEKGWRVDPKGNLIDNYGNKKFDKT